MTLSGQDWLTSFCPQAAQKVHLRLVIRRTIGAQNIVKPQWWFTIGIWLLPNVDRLGFPTHKTPVVAADLLSLENREMGIKKASTCARHVFGANDWTAI